MKYSHARIFHICAGMHPTLVGEKAQEWCWNAPNVGGGKSTRMVLECTQHRWGKNAQRGAYCTQRWWGKKHKNGAGMHPTSVGKKAQEWCWNAPNIGGEKMRKEERIAPNVGGGKSTRMVLECTQHRWGKNAMKEAYKRYFMACESDIISVPMHLSLVGLFYRLKLKERGRNCLVESRTILKM